MKRERVLKLCNMEDYAGINANAPPEAHFLLFDAKKNAFPAKKNASGHNFGFVSVT